MATPDLTDGGKACYSRYPDENFDRHGAPRLVVVPNSLADAINAKLDLAIAACPEAAKDREVLYGQLLEYFDEHGVIPDFSLQKNEASA